MTDEMPVKLRFSSMRPFSGIFMWKSRDKYDRAYLVSLKRPSTQTETLSILSTPLSSPIWRAKLPYTTEVFTLRPKIREDFFA